MTDEQRKALARIFRRYAQLMADIPALISLLDTYESRQETPGNWKEMWNELRKSEKYQEIIQKFEPIISWLETSSDERELIRLLQKISEEKPPN